MHDEPPTHISDLLASETEETPTWIQGEYAERLRGVNALLVFDMRQEEEEREG